MSTSRPSYAIIGGGIAGLTLAISLHKRNIPVTIYEQARRFGEVGADVAFTHNVVESMNLCDRSVYNDFSKVATHNQWESKKSVWFDFLDGMDSSSGSAGHQESGFQIKIPEGIVKFGKHLDEIKELDSGKLQMKFHDASSAEANAIVGCDGIKSQVRRILAGEDSPMAKHVYTYKYAYRDFVKIEEAMGEERAKSSGCGWARTDMYSPFPSTTARHPNLSRLKQQRKDWPDSIKGTLPAKRSEALKDFEAFGPNVLKLLELIKLDLEVWSIFDLGNHPLDTFNQGKICVVGDAAHATLPHHGAGAGFCIEDAAVLATILEREINETNGYIENVSVAELYEQAKRELKTRLK